LRANIARLAAIAAGVALTNSKNKCNFAEKLKFATKNDSEKLAKGRNFAKIAFFF
jgi:hypothetical protein